MLPTYRASLDTEGNAKIRWSYPKNLQYQAMLSNGPFYHGPPSAPCKYTFTYRYSILGMGAQ